MRGFTLIELILVIAIIAIVGAFSLPFAQSFQTTADLQTYADDMRQSFRRAQQLANSGVRSDDWGMYIDTVGNSMTLFKGSSYAGRDTDFDLITEFPESFSLTNNFSDEIVFTQFSGLPSQSGTATITDFLTSTNIGITVRGNGIIEQFNE